ncbi:MAG: hypothetical protein EHM33_32945, partial [Chloroflexi bacterium]
MKNNHIGLSTGPLRLFIIGIIMGGAIMIMIPIPGFLQTMDISFSDQTITLTPTPDTLPYLIALEPTGVPQAATRASASPTTT